MKTSRPLVRVTLTMLAVLGALTLPWALAPAGRAQPATPAPAPDAPTGDSTSTMTGTAPRAGTAARRRPAPRSSAPDAGTSPAASSDATGTAPSGTQPSGTQPAGTQPAGTQPAGTQETAPSAAQGTAPRPTGAAGASPTVADEPEGARGAAGASTANPQAGTDDTVPGRQRPPGATDTDPAPTPRGPGADLPSADAGVPSAEAADADAGVTEDAGVPAAAMVEDAGAPVVESDPSEEAEETAPAPPPPAPTTTFVQVPMPFVPATESSDPWAGLRELIPGIPTGGLQPAGLLALLALLALLSSFIERLRGRLLRDGWLPTLLSFTQVSVRLLGLLLALGLIIQVVPANVRWVVYFILMASGAALGWSTRDVMPDLIAGVVIVFERRIRRGIWIRSEAFSGAVERIGLRSSWLRDSKGHRVAVPNRLLMQVPVVSDEEGERVQEVVVRLGGADAADVRRALRDAVLASPWTTPESEPQVLRDPVDPDLWQVRGKLLSASFASSFQGQLLERAEAHLATQRQRARRDREAHSAEEGSAGAPTTKHPKLDKADKPPEKSDKSDKPDKPKAS